jgi:PAS domain S-box-containing protein
MASGVIVTDPGGGVLISNDQAVEIFGDPLDVEGLGDYGAYVGFHPDGSRFAAGDWPLARSLEHGEAVDGQLVEIERGDGTRRVISVSSAPVRSGADLVAAVATFSDVTDRARAQRRLAFLAEASTLLASSLDYEETLAAVSRIVVPAIADWCSISILEDDDTIKVVAWTHSDPERQRWADEMREKRGLHLADETPTAQVIRTGEPVLVPEITQELVDASRPEDLELVRVMGVRSFMVVPFTTGAGTFGSIMFVSAESGRHFDDDDLLLAREIGRRAGVAIENARLYRATEQRARAAEALEFVADGVFTIDRDGIVRLLNPAAASSLRLGPGAVGRPAAELVAGWEELAPLVPVVPVDERRIPRAETLPVETGDGEAWLSISGVSFAEGTVYAFRDVTEERGVERLKSDFVSTVSHELRTPLAAIYGAALTLRRADMPLADDQRQDLLGVIADEADRLARIVNDILWTSRIESGVIKVQIESCDARELARSVVHAARLHVPETHELALEAPDDLPRVAADPDKVRQVLSNLVDNAVKYSPAGGGVEVRIEGDERVVRFVVEDEGLGIPAGDRDRVFEKFYRLDPDLNRGVGGTGLGLYICRELVRRMDGWIWIEERTPRGSRLVVELPALA